MLAALYTAAWESATPNQKQIADFVFYDDLKSESQPSSDSKSETQPTKPREK